MSTSQQARDSAATAQAKVQSHPAYLQAKDKTNYYMSQLDKEVSDVGGLV